MIQKLIKALQDELQIIFRLHQQLNVNHDHCFLYIKCSF